MNVTIRPLCVLVVVLLVACWCAGLVTPLFATDALIAGVFNAFMAIRIRRCAP